MSDLFDTTTELYGQIDGHVATLVLNRPDKRNAFTTALWQRFVAVLTALEESPARVILITSSAPAAFSGGADIAELATMVDDPARAEGNRAALREAQGRLAACIKPTIAVIPGACFGAGCGLALHADMRLASDRARFGITPAKLGLVYPLRDTARLVSIVGAARAKLMLYGAQQLDARRAYDYGLVDQLHSPETLDDAAASLASDIARLSPTAIDIMRQQFDHIAEGQGDDDAWTSQAFVARHGAPDMREGVAAFLEKRQAIFADRDKG